MSTVFDLVAAQQKRQDRFEQLRLKLNLIVIGTVADHAEGKLAHLKNVYLFSQAGGDHFARVRSCSRYGDVRCGYNMNTFTYCCTPQTQLFGTGDDAAIA